MTLFHMARAAICPHLQNGASALQAKLCRTTALSRLIQPSLTLELHHDAGALPARTGRKVLDVCNLLTRDPAKV